MNELASRECVPCRGGVPPLKGQEITKLESELEGWEVVNEHHLRKEYKFKDFKESQAFGNRVGDLAEQQRHHPDICFPSFSFTTILVSHESKDAYRNVLRRFMVMSMRAGFRRLDGCVAALCA